MPSSPKKLRFGKVWTWTAGSRHPFMLIRKVSEHMDVSAWEGFLLKQGRIEILEGLSEETPINGWEPPNDDD
jgi:hypothetical protein